MRVRRNEPGSPLRATTEVSELEAELLAKAARYLQARVRWRLDRLSPASDGAARDRVELELRTVEELSSRFERLAAELQLEARRGWPESEEQGAAVAAPGA
jgi:hypothetical protein